MATTKRFAKLVSLLNNDKANEYAKEAGVIAVKAIYAGDDAEMVLALLNGTNAHVRKAFASWFRAYGVLVVNPAVGSTEYTVGDETGALVKSKKAQAKVFAVFAAGTTADVLAQEVKVKEAKKPAALKGAPEDRAAKKVAALIKSLRKYDAEAAAWLNDVWAHKVEVTTLNALEAQFLKAA